MKQRSLNLEDDLVVDYKEKLGSDDNLCRIHRVLFNTCVVCGAFLFAKVTLFVYSIDVFND